MNKNNDNKSIVDEFNRNKRMHIKFKFSLDNIEDLWNAFLKTFSKTFHINKEIYEGFKFNLKIKNINSQYEIIQFDINKKILEMKWMNFENSYWLKFKLRKKYYGKGYVINITETIYRKKPFFGLQDTAGLIWLKSNFKKEMRNFRKSIDIVLANNGEIPLDLNNFNETKSIQVIKKIKINNFSELLEMFKKFYNIKSLNLHSQFVSKYNKYSLKYYIENIDNDNELIQISWNQEQDKYCLSIMMKNNRLYFIQKVTSIWTQSNKYKLKLIKKNLHEYANEFINLK